MRDKSRKYTIYLIYILRKVKLDYVTRPYYTLITEGNNADGRKLRAGKMIIETKTKSGKSVIMNIESGTLTVQGMIDNVNFEGPSIFHHEGERHFALKFTDADGKVWNATISDQENTRIRNLRSDYRDGKLEAAIPGLKRLMAARDAEESYNYAFNRMMEDEHNDGARAPATPKENYSDLIKQLPRAALYLKAKGYSSASNHYKSGAGRQAVAILEAGGSEKEAGEILKNWLPDTAWNN